MKTYVFVEVNVFICVNLIFASDIKDLVIPAKKKYLCMIVTKGRNSIHIRTCIPPSEMVQNSQSLM
jgi:hypothetical protein